jgi:antitoxin (DNA-binding transcriptional repressor) of toxin-antitoxin stability system
MGETILTITEAAHHFADCVDRTHHQNETFVLVKNGVPFARLVPAGQPAGRGREVAKALASAELSDDEARAWYRDLKAARRKLKAPADV